MLDVHGSVAEWQWSHRWSYSTLRPVSTEMGDRSRVCHLINQPATQTNSASYHYPRANGSALYPRANGSCSVAGLVSYGHASHSVVYTTTGLMA